MDSILKAKVIIELLDDRKYSVLSSFSNDELNKINNVSLDEINNLGASEINKIITDFLANVDSKVALNKVETQADSQPIPEQKSQQPDIAPLPPLNVQEESSEVLEKPLTIEEKIQQQPIQLLACALEQLSNDKKDVLLSHLSEEKKKEIESAQVEKTPITDQIVKILLDELDLV